MHIDFEKAVDQKQDFSMTLQILCEEFREADEAKLQKKQQKRSKRKGRRQIKTNEITEVCFSFRTKPIRFYFNLRIHSRIKQIK